MRDFSQRSSIDPGTLAGNVREWIFLFEIFEIFKKDNIKFQQHINHILGIKYIFNQ